MKCKHCGTEKQEYFGIMACPNLKCPSIKKRPITKYPILKDEEGLPPDKDE